MYYCCFFFLYILDAVASLSFDILQSEYNYIGYPIYISLFVAIFAGSATGVAQLVQNRADLVEPVRGFQHGAVWVALLFLVVFLVITSYGPLRYIIAGGEV